MVLVWGGEVGVILLGACRLSGEKIGGGEKVFGGGLNEKESWVTHLDDLAL